MCPACNRAHRAHHPKCPKSREYKQSQLEKNQGSLNQFFNIPSKVKVKPPSSSIKLETRSNSSSNRKVINPYLKKLLPSPNVATKPPPTIPSPNVFVTKPPPTIPSPNIATKPLPKKEDPKLESTSPSHVSTVVKKVIQN